MKSSSDLMVFPPASLYAVAGVSYSENGTAFWRSGGIAAKQEPAKNRARRPSASLEQRGAMTAAFSVQCLVLLVEDAMSDMKSSGGSPLLLDDGRLQEVEICKKKRFAA